MITIKDVAREAGVSIGTASRTLHNKGYVSKKNKEKILNAAAKLGYVVNVNAMQLKQKDQKTVGIIVSDLTNQYFSAFIQNLRTKLKELSYDLIVSISNGSSIEEEKQIKYLIGSKVSTILFIPSTTNNHKVLSIAKKYDVKMIQLFIRAYEDYSSIVNDDANGVYQAATLLANEKYKRICLLDIDIEKNIYPRREDGIEKAKSENPDVQFNTLKIIPTNGFNNEDIARIEEFNPDALIAGTGLFGLNVLEYLKKSSRKIKLVSFDDNEWLEYLGITAIRQSRNRLLNETISLITSESNDVRHVTIEETLIVRN